MIKYNLYCACLKDETGFPVACVTGDIAFILGTFKKSIQEAKVDTDIRDILEKGKVNFVRAYVGIVDDNDVKLNTFNECSCNVNFLTADLLKYDITDKDFNRKYRKEFAILNSGLKELEMEVKKDYERRKQEEFERTFNSNKK